jgi:hypothetical protein
MPKPKGMNVSLAAFHVRYLKAMLAQQPRFAKRIGIPTLLRIAQKRLDGLSHSCRRCPQ